MTKNKLLAALFLTAVIAATTMASCNKDDDEPVSQEPEDLVGKWELLEWKSIENGETEVETYNGEYILTFNENGTFKWSNNFMDDGKWSIREGVLIMKTDYGETDECDFKIQSTTLTIETSVEFDDLEYWDRMTFKKVKGNTANDNAENKDRKDNPDDDYIETPVSTKKYRIRK